MPAPSLIRWRGLELHPAADGSLAHVRLEGHRDDLLSDLAVRLEGGWELVTTDFLLDEVEQRHELRRDGALVATAVVRQTFDDTWGIRLQLRNESDVELTVPAAHLAFTSAWPERCWLAGAEGTISVDPGRDDGELLTFTQLRGRGRLSEGRRWLTDLPVRLGPAGTPAGMYQVSWRVDWLRDERMQAAALPSWWPERTVLRRDETLDLQLPDAAIEAAGISILDDDHTTLLSARPGHHLAQVHARRGTTDVELFWADDLLTAHLRPAVLRALDDDLRLLAPHQVFLMGRGLAAAVGEGLDEALPVAVENLAARPGPVAPLALAAVADECLRSGDAELADQLPELAARVQAAPGALTCWLHAGLAARLVAGIDRLPAPHADQALDTVDRAIVELETELLRQHAHLTPSGTRTAALLGAGLPGNVLDPWRRAVLVAALSLAPDTWDEQPRWPVGLGAVTDQARDRLLAENCADEVLAWLLW